MECFTTADLRKLCQKNTKGLGRDEMCQLVQFDTDTLACLTVTSLKKVADKVARRNDIQKEEMKMIKRFRKADLVKWLFQQLNEQVVAPDEVVVDEVVESRFNIAAPYKTARPEGDLGWDIEKCPLQLDNRKWREGKVEITDGKKYKEYEEIECEPQSTEYKEMFRQLAEIAAPFHKDWCVIEHESMPGIQFSNTSSSKMRYEYGEEVDADNHWTRKFGEKEYCMCREYNESQHMNLSLVKPFEDEEWWTAVHGERSGLKARIDPSKIVGVDFKEGYKGSVRLTLDLGEDEWKSRKVVQRFKNQEEAEKALEQIRAGEDVVVEIDTTWKKIPNEEKERIRQDVILAAGKKTYKVHFQPKPEYQIWFIQQLFHVLSDPEILPWVEAFKTILPYPRVSGEKRIPAVVVYPIEGQKPSKIILNSLAGVFSQYAEEVGMNLVPRFNHRYDHLTYWANGNGDTKQMLLSGGGEALVDVFFDRGVCAGSEESPFCHYHHWRCPDNVCHIQPE